MTLLRDGLLLATGTLTTVRVPPPAQVDRRRGALAMVLAPVAVLPLAGTVALVAGTGGVLGASPLVLAALAVAVLALGTRVLHLDGLADTCDALAVPDRGPADRDAVLARRQAVMHAGDTGPAGVVGVVLVLALQAAAGAAVLARPHGWLLLAGLVLASRGLLPLACRRGVAGTGRGGLGAAVVGTVPTPVAAAVLVLAALAVAGLQAVTGGPAWQGALAVVAAAGAVAHVLRLARTRLGGVNGDVLGACVETALAVLLVVASVG